MTRILILAISLLISNKILAQYGTQDYGGGGGYGQQQGGYNQQQGGQNQPAKGNTGLERKGLLDSMEITDKTSLTEDEKCKTKCNMTFVQCYRLQTDRSKCYSVQQECLGKCGGEADSNPDFNSAPQGQQGQGGQLEFGSGGY